MLLPQLLPSSGTYPFTQALEQSAFFVHPTDSLWKDLMLTKTLRWFCLDLLLQWAFKEIWNPRFYWIRTRIVHFFKQRNLKVPEVERWEPNRVYTQLCPTNLCPSGHYLWLHDCFQLMQWLHGLQVSLHNCFLFSGSSCVSQLPCDSHPSFLSPQLNPKSPWIFSPHLLSTHKVKRKCLTHEIFLCGQKTTVNKKVPNTFCHINFCCFWTPTELLTSQSHLHLTGQSLLLWLAQPLKSETTPCALPTRALPCPTDGDLLCRSCRSRASDQLRLP